MKQLLLPFEQLKELDEDEDDEMEDLESQLVV